MKFNILDGINEIHRILSLFILLSCQRFGTGLQDLPDPTDDIRILATEGSGDTGKYVIPAEAGIQL